ncbi:MAG: carbohydrate ABC transporter permease [Candidatus Tectimicrobiota bacterium]
MPKKRRHLPLLYLYLTSVSLMMLTPILLMGKISVSHPADILQPHKEIFWGPAGLTLEHWRAVFTAGLLWPSLGKSLLVATLVMVLAILIAAPAAYVLARLGSAWKYLCMVSLFLSRAFPEVAIALPVSVVFLRWNLLDTSFGLILAHLIKVLPYVAWILIGTFETIPRALEEASAVDGASKLRTLRTVIIPLARSGLAVAAMLAWLESWNEFTYALYLSMSEYTLPLRTYYYVSRGSIFHSAAYATIITLPVIAVTFVLQRRITSDMLAGGVK